MGLILNGNAPSKMLYNGAEVSLYFNGSKIWPEEAPGFDEVTIGTQTWMSKNLTINDGQGGIDTKTLNYGQGDVVEYYYTWAAAVRVAGTISGWHLPSKNEWDTLKNTTNVSALKSTYGWTTANGSDTYGFSVFPAGQLHYSNPENSGTNAFFWTNTVESDKVYYYTIAGSSMWSIGPYAPQDYYKYSVRLIKDS